jgi:hypothetical protein
MARRSHVSLPPRLLASISVAAVLAAAAAPAAGEVIGGNPGPAHNYVCPNADGKPALDCYFDAVAHLYTMCRQVKSIELIEFGYEKSTEGTNGAKSEYCVVKQKNAMTKPYVGALRDAAVSKQASEAVRSLQEYWLGAMAALAWRAAESDAEYKARTMEPYDRFAERIAGIKEILAVVKSRTTPAPAAPATGGKAKR